MSTIEKEIYEMLQKTARKKFFIPRRKLDAVILTALIASIMTNVMLVFMVAKLFQMLH